MRAFARQSTANIRENMRRLTARPHHVGSPYDKDNAEWMLAQVQGVGLGRRDRDLRRAVPHAEGAAPRAGRADAASRAKLEEPAVAGDPTSSQKRRAAADLQRLFDRRRRHRRRSST